MQPIILIFLSLVCVLLLTAALYLFLIAPRKSNRRTAYFAAVRYAHRGLHGGELPENSLAAFALAAERGFGIELDVQLSRDGEVVVFHDANLLRVCGVDAPLKEKSARELAALPLCGKEGHTVPTLAQVLETVRGRVPLLIEIKGETGLDELCRKTAAQMERYNGEWCMESFSPFALRWFKKNCPSVVRGQLCMHFSVEKEYRSPKYRVLQALLTNAIGRPDFMALNFRDADFFPFALMRRVYRTPCFAWTPRNEQEIDRALQRFDTVIFETEKGAL